MIDAHSFPEVSGMLDASLTDTGIHVELTDIMTEKVVHGNFTFNSLALNFLEDISTVVGTTDQGVPLVGIKSNDVDAAQSVKDVCIQLRYLADYIENEYSTQTLHEWKHYGHHTQPEFIKYMGH